MVNKIPISPASGFTLIEMTVVIGVFLILFVGSATLYSDTINTNATLTGSLNAQMDVRKAFNSMVADIRSASPSSSGAYTIDTASSTYFAYYSDINNDGLKEKIRYFLSGKTLEVGIIKPTGLPLTYNSANEVVTNLISNVVNPTSSPLFYYYDDSYNGTSSPMSMPIFIPNVRLIKIDVKIDQNPLKPPGPQEFTTQISIRGLKDNL
jgi:prepilin-type N-terminal cleavage/methylation domain-containing protein